MAGIFTYTLFNVCIFRKCLTHGSLIIANRVSFITITS